MKSAALLNHASRPDAALLEAMQAGDETAFAELYKRYSYQLFNVAYGKLKNREVAEELVQDLFETLWSKRSTAQVQQVGNYLFAALRYRIINYIKSEKVRTSYEFFCHLNQSEADRGTEATVALNDLNEALAAGMQHLSEKTQEVFRLSRLEQYTIPEISLRVNLSEKTVEYHLRKSLKLMRLYLRHFLMLIWPLLFFIK
ncbi:RNA polymerase sigma factor [Hymenobacter cellulosivorans]|uniref:Sigma-70 family RNA polymerase sigma factor n=1 Tax=Hymenobacter cellulosivorans TaxID=2932249 RepID=A0ABY4F8V8_9BACT|nr:sigma-70 family RNA polymerase sigma factor [Hymenobacter cellulosivorans]UOQ52364.1 sigma-70 family RNA polymerase sigma factor [Hymenobacter cellulosivorans]